MENTVSGLKEVAKEYERQFHAAFAPEAKIAAQSREDAITAELIDLGWQKRTTKRFREFLFHPEIGRVEFFSQGGECWMTVTDIATLRQQAEQRRVRTAVANWVDSL